MWFFGGKSYDTIITWQFDFDSSTAGASELVISVWILDNSIHRKEKCSAANAVWFSPRLKNKETSRFIILFRPTPSYPSRLHSSSLNRLISSLFPWRARAFGDSNFYKTHLNSEKGNDTKRKIYRKNLQLIMAVWGLLVGNLFFFFLLKLTLTRWRGGVGLSFNSKFFFSL